jgi:hypothetical protein
LPDVPAGHIGSVHRELELDGIRFRWGRIPPCGNPECNCGDEGAVAVYATLGQEDRWFGFSTLSPHENASHTLQELAEGGPEWSTVKAWLENDSALYGVPWENVCVSAEAPRKIMQWQSLASLKTPARFRSEPPEGLLALRRYINEYDPRLVLKFLALMDDYAKQTDTLGPAGL